jgi:hypothetical protein
MVSQSTMLADVDGIFAPTILEHTPETALIKQL